MSNEDFQETVRRKLLGSMKNNGNNQKVINIDEVEKFLESTGFVISSGGFCGSSWLKGCCFSVSRLPPQGGWLMCSVFSAERFG